MTTTPVRPDPPSPDAPERELLAPAPPVDARAAHLQRVLDGRWAPVRERARDLLPADWFQPTDHLATDALRAQTLTRLRELAALGEHRYGFSAAVGGGEDTGAQTVNFEMLAHGDLSLSIKAGVQWGLFAGSIQALGTARHHEAYLRGALDTTLLGCFAMTETGHGSDVASLGTTATFDPATDTLVVHTPDLAARKDYIGNAAADATLAVVFAQLIVGEQRHGVHAVVVPIRDADGNALPGVTLSDCGRKEGLNGVDNGRIVFDAVRVPRENLLDRYGSLAADGTYTTSSSSANARFFTTLGALVKGRVSLSASALAASRVALAIAVGYGERRRQFSRGRVAGGEEVLLLDYRTHQRRLLVPLAGTIALTIAQEELTAQLHRVTNTVLQGGSPDPAAQRELEAEAAGMKAVATWHAIASIQTAREACGGAGYLSENRIAQLRADTDIYATFEGDNTVLLQLLGRHLLGARRDALRGAGRVGAATAVASSVVDSLASRTPARSLAALLGQVAADVRPGARGEDAPADLLDRAWQLRTLAWRERHLLGSVSMRLRRRLAPGSGVDAFEAGNDVAEHLVALARAHVDVVVARAVHAAIGAIPDPPTAQLLSRVLDLHVTSRLEAERAWYLERGWLSAARSKALPGLVSDLAAQLRPDAATLVASFALPDSWLGAAIVA